MIRRLRSSFKVKMMLGFLLVNFVTLSVSYVVSSYYFSESAKREFHRSSSLVVDSINYQMQVYLQYLKKATLPFITDPIVQSYLTSLDRPQYQQMLDIEKLLQRQLALQFSEISGMFLIKNDTSRSVVTTLGNYYANPEYYADEPWFRNPPSDEVVIYPTHPVQYSRQPGNIALSISLPIHDMNKTGLIGHLVIDFSPQQLEDSIKTINLGQRGEVFIVSEQDTFVYHSDNELLGRPRAGTSMGQIDIYTGEKASIQQIGGEKWIISGVHSPVTGWIIVSMVPLEVKAQDLNAAQRSAFLAFAILQLLLLVMIPYLTFRFTRPINRLIQSMKKVSKGDFSAMVEVPKQQDEIKLLMVNYNEMVGQLDHLMNTVYELRLQEMKLQLNQKEVMIQALQNQINPHLLYNSLELIRSTAQFNQVEHTETIARNLSMMYRYNAKFTMEEVTIKDELDHLVRYLEIVNIRFSYLFQSQLYVNEKYYSCRCIKLVLQPIVENAVKYAIEPKEGEGTITVSAYQSSDDLIVEIADNGSGFEEEELEKITRSLDSITANSDSYDPGDSLGLRNVHARLVLKYGTGYGLQIKSFYGRGTIVSVRIPFSTK